MLARLIKVMSITALAVLVNRLVLRKPPSHSYRIPEDRWLRRGYRKP
jgi:hypothetical protein